jgi:gas vesicle protein
MYGNSRVFGAFLVGATIGATIALLFAPKTGRETRRLISRKAEEGADYVTSKSREFRQQAEDLIDKAEGFIDRGVKTAEKIADRSKSYADRVV